MEIKAAAIGLNKKQQKKKHKHKIRNEKGREEATTTPEWPGAKR
jgi:hypothetical protein